MVALGRLRRAWLFANYRRGGIAAISKRLLLADRCESLLSLFGASVGEECVLLGPLVIHNATRNYENLCVGRNVHLGRMVILDLAERLLIEDDATVSMGVTILTHSDVGDRPLSRVYPRQAHATRIGSGAWIGANAVILSGCDVGARAVVGAGAVVRQAVPDDEVVGGVPARPLPRSAAALSKNAPDP